MERHRIRSMVIVMGAGAIIAVPAALKARLLFGRPAPTPTAAAALTPEVVQAMEWLRDHSTPLQTVLVPSTTDASVPSGAADCLAIAERQAYIANVRYSPGGYIPIWKGDPPPLQGRIDEARAVFRAEPGAAARLAGRTRVRWAVLDRARGERFDENALRAELGEPAFANARVAIWRIEPPTSIEEEPKRP